MAVGHFRKPSEDVQQEIDLNKNLIAWRITWPGHAPFAQAIIKTKRKQNRNKCREIVTGWLANGPKRGSRGWGRMRLSQRGTLLFWVFIILASGDFLFARPLLMATNKQQPTASSNINKYPGHARLLPHMLPSSTEKNRRELKAVVENAEKLGSLKISVH